MKIVKSVNLPDDLWDYLDLMKKKENRSISGQLIHIIEQYRANQKASIDGEK
ncbi:MAG: hypothetical protein KTR28_08800 [Micavibrio sp.]|nr:hypothetical protein [Micavibrio sp.]